MTTHAQYRGIHDPKKIVDDEYASEEDYIYSKEKGDFILRQIYEDNPVRTIICKHCKSDRFIVGQGHCYTAIKCVNCGYELNIHEG